MMNQFLRMLSVSFGTTAAFFGMMFVFWGGSVIFLLGAPVILSIGAFQTWSQLQTDSQNNSGALVETTVRIHAA